MIAAVFLAAVSSLSGIWSFSKDGGEWRNVRVPHDWAIEGPFNRKEPGWQGKLPWKGEGRYRRTFDLSAADRAMLLEGGRAYLAFDGAMASPRVKLNGKDLGGTDYGYMSFTLDATEAIRGASNLLEVACSTKLHSSRWYPGAGLYRDVRLKVVPKRHVLPGTMRISAEVADDLSAAKVTVRYVSSVGGEQAYSFNVDKPRLWRLDDPFLYALEAEGESFRYGIRSFRFDPDRGFSLNGVRVQLRGVDLHSDLGPLGMAYDRDAMRRQLLLMKDMGFNALRTSHNCPCPDVLDLCDEMGVFVWDECFDNWSRGATGRAEDANLEEYVEANLREFVRRDRNHPCVFVWSIGNELPGWSDKDDWHRCGMRRDRFERFCTAIREEDATRPVGIACCHLDTLDELPGLYEPLDIVGWNYGEKYVSFRAKYSDKCVLYTESASALSEVGYYELPVAAHKEGYSRDVLRVGSYDHCAAPWSDIPDHEFARMERDAFCGGEFVWTGIDYLGEPTPIANGATFGISTNEELLARSSYFGAADLCGLPKDRFWLYRSHWNKSAETVHVVPDHWNFARAHGREAPELPVYVYTSGDSAELFLNGRSLGVRRKGDAPERVPGCTNDYYDVCAKYRLRWFGVRYEPGEIRAVAYRGGKAIGEDVVRTAGEPARLALSDDPYNAQDAKTRFVRVEAVDAAGTRCPFAADRVAFAISGPGEIVAVGNGNPRGYDSFKDVASHPLHCGRCVAVVRRTGEGKLVLSASSRDLSDASIEIR